jgi:hypothetical protein
MKPHNKFEFIYRRGSRLNRSRCVWLVQRRIPGGWTNQRQSNGMPLIGATEHQAEQLVRTLDGTNTYRIIKIKD